MLCKKCYQVRARCLMTATPIARHLKQHERVEMDRKVNKKKKVNKKNNGILYDSSLSQSRLNSAPIPLTAQEFRPAPRHEEENRISSQISLVEAENNPCPLLKENLISNPIPEAIKTYGSINVGPHEMLECGGTKSYQWSVM